VALHHLVIVAVAAGVLAVAAPQFAPQLLATLVHLPGGDDSSPDNAPRAAGPTPPQQLAPAPPASIEASRVENVTASPGRAVSLHADAVGQFEATASIDGTDIPVIVDTGATSVALSAETARRLGILPPQSAFRLLISTANGTTSAAPVVLNDVRVGGITVRNVQAVVVAGDALSVNLLGMTFLSRLSQFAVANAELTLRE
jgi:aspartyl protease family protein